jgi:hypothetical protein
MLTTMFQSWRYTNKPAVVVAAADDDEHAYNDKALPPTPGLKPVPPSIAQLAYPSPDESSSPSDSSNASHEPFADLTKSDVAAPRQPNRLRKPPPSSYPFSFVPENPSPQANFPYSFHRHRSTPNSPATSFIAAPARPLSMHPPVPPRKLTKRRPSIHEPPPSAAADLSMARIAEHPPPPPPPLLRRNTFNFNSFRRKKSSLQSAQSEDGHSPLPALPPPSPLLLNIVSTSVLCFGHHRLKRVHCSRPSGHSTPVDAIPGTSSLLLSHLSRCATPAPLPPAT